MNDFLFYKKEFMRLAREYIDNDNVFYKVKLRHTVQVVNIITRLGIDLNLSNHQLLIARLAALFHDLGRFYQLNKYGTFDDSVSGDHAGYSVSLIDDHDVFRAMAQEDKELICTSILEHNKKYISEGLCQEALYQSQLLRDADKISNFPFFIKNYDRWEMPRTNEYRKDMIDSILDKTPIDNSHQNFKTMEDVYLYHLSWFNDLNYDVSINYVFEKKYVQGILDKITCANTSCILTEHFNSFKEYEGGCV